MRVKTSAQKRSLWWFLLFLCFAVSVFLGSCRTLSTPKARRYTFSRPLPKKNHTCVVLCSFLKGVRYLMPSTVVPLRRVASSGRQTLHANRDDESRLHRAPGTLTFGIVFANVVHLRCFTQSKTSYHCTLDCRFPLETVWGVGYILSLIHI